MNANQNIIFDCVRLILKRNITCINFIESEKIINKMFKCFISSDGSMTRMLMNLYDDLQMKLEYDGQLINKDLLSCVTKITDHYLECDITERRISFWNKDDRLMTGISFWDRNFYDELYPSETVKKIPIGSILQKMEVEFYRGLKYFVVEIDGVKAALRFSFYKNKGRVVFLLIEIFESLSHLESIFNEI